VIAVTIPLWTLPTPIIAAALALDLVPWLRSRFGGGRRRSAPPRLTATTPRSAADIPRVRVLQRTGSSERRP
jgi:hypothetical protein